MAQFIVVYDTVTQGFVSSGETVVNVGSAVFSDQNFDVTASSQSIFQSALAFGQARLDVFVDGILKREGSSYNYQRNVASSTIEFNSPVLQNAWVLVRTYS